MKSHNQSINNIACAANAGDPDVWESILSFSSKWTDAQARKQGFSPSEARELASDVAEKVRVCFVRFESRPGDSFEGWLYRVQQSCKNDRHRIQNRDLKRFTSLSAVLNQASKESSAEECLMRKDRQDLVRGAVEQLSELDQKILWMRYWEGMSYREIGENLGLAVGTVRNRSCEAHKILKPILEPYLDELI